MRLKNATCELSTCQCPQLMTVGDDICRYKIEVDLEVE
jgi:hypothetical protein